MKEYLLLIFMGSSCGILILMLFQGRPDQTLTREEAIIKGHAEWVSDTNGRPQFQWKECK